MFTERDTDTGKVRTREHIQTQFGLDRQTAASLICRARTQGVTGIARGAGELRFTPADGYTVETFLP